MEKTKPEFELTPEMKPKELLSAISEAYIREEPGKIHSFDRRGFFYLVDFDEGEITVYTSDKGRAIGRKGANVKRLQRNTGMKVFIKDFSEIPQIPREYPILRRWKGELKAPSEWAPYDWEVDLPKIDIEEIKRSAD